MDHKKKNENVGVEVKSEDGTVDAVAGVSEGSKDDIVAGIIAEIERLLAARATPDDFVTQIKRLVAAAPLSLGTNHTPGTKLYRATNHHVTVPRRIDEVWYPPADRAALGRANRPKRPVFYCTSDPGSAFAELGVGVGQYAVHSTWENTAAMRVHDLGYTSQVLARAGSRRVLPERHRIFYEQELKEPAARAVRDFIALQFTHPTAERYALTAAIAEVHMLPDLAGIAYPAVSLAANVDNVALHPHFVRENMQLVAAQLLRIRKVTEAGVETYRLADLTGVDADGALHWTFTAASSALNPGESLRLRPGETIFAQSFGEILIEGRRYRLETGYQLDNSGPTPIVRDLRGEPVSPLP